MNRIRTFSRLALLCLGVALLAPAPVLAAGASAHAQLPCWKRLLNDWYDGTINNIYPHACYQSAIQHLPKDLIIYSNAKQDIEAAEQAAARGQQAPPESSQPPSTTTTTTTASGASGGSTPTPPAPKKTGIHKIFADLTPGGPGAFPLPLLILGALAILLVLAGAAGMLWQRSHPREEPPPA